MRVECRAIRSNASLGNRHVAARRVESSQPEHYTTLFCWHSTSDGTVQYYTLHFNSGRMMQIAAATHTQRSGGRAAECTELYTSQLITDSTHQPTY